MPAFPQRLDHGPAAGARATYPACGPSRGIARENKDVSRFGTAFGQFRSAAKRPPRKRGVGTQAEDGAGYRGGNWNNASANARASDRNNAANVNANRNNNNGSRVVRTAP